MSADVLVLNSHYSLLEVVPWEKAIGLLFQEKAEMVQAYADRFVRSPSLEMPLPAVIRRLKEAPLCRRVRLSRKHLLARDKYTCQYCGRKPKKSGGAPDLKALTLDHVVPRAAAVNGYVMLPWSGLRVRVTSWENLVASCEPCNTKKGHQPLYASGMRLRRFPAAPSTYEVVLMSIYRYEPPAEWKHYLPAKSPWRDYWEVELTD